MSTLRAGLNGEPLRVTAVFGPEVAGGPAPLRAADYNAKLAAVLVRVGAALAIDVPVMQQVGDARLNLEAGCVEVVAYVFEGQEPQQVQQDLLAAVQAVPVTVGATAIESARVAALRERNTHSTGPEAAQRWQAPAPKETP